MQAQERQQKEHEETSVPGQQVAERLNDDGLWTSGKAVLGTEIKKKCSEGALFFSSSIFF